MHERWPRTKRARQLITNGEPVHQVCFGNFNPCFFLLLESAVATNNPLATARSPRLTMPPSKAPKAGQVRLDVHWIHQIKSTVLLLLFPSSPSSPAHVPAAFTLLQTDDLATLDTLDDKILLNELKVRYKSNNIYSYVGDILVRGGKEGGDPPSSAAALDTWYRDHVVLLYST